MRWSICIWIWCWIRWKIWWSPSWKSWCSCSSMCFDGNNNFLSYVCCPYAFQQGISPRNDASLCYSKFYCVPYLHRYLILLLAHKCYNLLGFKWIKFWFLASWSKYYGFEPMNEFSSAMDNVKNSMNEAKEKLINWFFFILPYLQPSFYQFTTWSSKPPSNCTKWLK